MLAVRQTFWGPEPLDSAAFRELLPLLDTAAEAAAIVRAFEGVTDILDVGGGTGLLSRTLAGRARLTIIEPDPDQRAHAPRDLTVREGRAESLPFADDSVDGALASWVLQYTHDPFTAIAELGRVARQRVAIVQAAPGNDLVDAYNREAAIAGVPPADHAWLLGRATEILEADGFTVTLERISIPVRLPEGGAAALADTLTRMHFSAFASRPEMVTAVTALLAERAQTLNDDGMLLVARR